MISSQKISLFLFALFIPFKGLEPREMPSNSTSRVWFCGTCWSNVCLHRPAWSHLQPNCQRNFMGIPQRLQGYGIHLSRLSTGFTWNNILYWSTWEDQRMENRLKTRTRVLSGILLLAKEQCWASHPRKCQKPSNIKLFGVCIGDRRRKNI